MVVVKEFAPQLQVQFSVKLGDALLDMLRLYFEIFVVIESYFHCICVLFLVSILTLALQLSLLLLQSLQTGSKSPCFFGLFLFS